MEIKEKATESIVPQPLRADLGGLNAASLAA